MALVSPPADLVVEIGPGEGALTAASRACGRPAGAVEVDAELAARLTARFAGSGAGDPRADARSPTGRRCPPGSRSGGRILIVGNLPYSVGKPILMALAEAAPALAAPRPPSSPSCSRTRSRSGWRRSRAGKVYGSLSVLSQLVFDVRLAFTVPPGAFRPPPLVDSAVLHLRALREPPVPVADPRRLREVVRAAFAQRRKSLANALAGGLGLPAERGRAVLADLRIDPTRRAETLSLAEFARLAAALETA